MEIIIENLRKLLCYWNVCCQVNAGSLPEMKKETALHFNNVIRKVIKPLNDIFDIKEMKKTILKRKEI